jgi:hypothetical protein
MNGGPAAIQPNPSMSVSGSIADFCSSALGANGERLLPRLEF